MCCIDLADHARKTRPNDVHALLHSVFATNANSRALVVALFDTGVRRD